MEKQRKKSAFICVICGPFELLHLRDWFASYRVALIVVIALVAAYLFYPHLGRKVDRPQITEIVFWTPTQLSDELRVGIEAFERRYPQYEVVTGVATVRDATGDPTRFLLGVAGGVPPDLIYFDRFAVVEWASRGAFADLTSYLEQDRTRENGIHPKNYYRPAWNEAVYRGRVYAVPNSVDTRALYYHHDALIRAGFVFEHDDEPVQRGAARAGDPKAPRTWEQVCHKLVHAEGRVTQDGVVHLDGWTRRPSVNERMPTEHPIDLEKSGVRTGDVVTIIRGSEVFRARIAQLLQPDALRLDLTRELPPNSSSVPGKFVDRNCQIKVFDQDGYAIRLTRFDPETGAMTTAGFIPLFGNSWLYMYGWLNGARFMSPDGTQCTLDSPPIVAALQWLTDVYDALGGMQVASAFQSSVMTGALDPFLTGKIAMRIDSDGFISRISAFKSDLTFGVAGAPIPETRRAAGHASIGWMGGWAYAIPSTAKQKNAAWALLRWLSSVEANQLMTEFRASMSRSKGQVFFPSLHPHRQVMQWLENEFVEDNLAVTDSMKRGFGQFVDLLPTSKYRPVTPVGQKLWSEHVRATDTAIRHIKLPYDALKDGKRQVQLALERHLNPPTGPPVRWNRIIVVYVLCVTLVFLFLIVYQRWRNRQFGNRRRGWMEGYVCASPWLIGFIVLGAGPIIFSLIISFSHYDVLSPARYVGLTNYINLVGRHDDLVSGQRVFNDPQFWRSLTNTAFMLIGVPLGITGGLALALLLNTKVRGLPIFRTIYYLPAIVPAVAAFVLWIWVFDPVRGLINQVLRSLGVSEPPHWLQDPVWAKPALVLMGLWGVGSGMIIWIAGLKEIPQTLYEAARIDGAGRWQQFRFVTLPLLTPYIFFNIVMGLIGVFQIFEAAYVMTDGGPADATLFYAYKLFNESFRYLNLGTASAMAWILFLAVLIITLTQLWLGRKWVHYER